KACFRASMTVSGLERMAAAWGLPWREGQAANGTILRRLGDGLLFERRCLDQASGKPSTIGTAARPGSPWPTLFGSRVDGKERGKRWRARRDSNPRPIVSFPGR